MGENKLKIYCETSFGSYLNGRPTPLQHIAIKQAATVTKNAFNCPVIITPIDFLERKEEFGL